MGDSRRDLRQQRAHAQFIAAVPNRHSHAPPLRRQGQQAVRVRGHSVDHSPPHIVKMPVRGLAGPLDAQEQIRLQLFPKRPCKRLGVLHGSLLQAGCRGRLGQGRPQQGNGGRVGHDGHLTAQGSQYPCNLRRAAGAVRLSNHIIPAIDGKAGQHKCPAAGGQRPGQLRQGRLGDGQSPPAALEGLIERLIKISLFHLSHFQNATL